MLRKVNFDDLDPFEQTASKIKIMQEAILSAGTLNRIATSKEVEGNIRPQDRKDYAALIQKMHIPQGDEMIVNVMWINKEKDNDPNGFVFPKEYNRNRVEIKTTETINIFERLNEWADHFPKVVFWYDGTLVSEGSVVRTFEEIQQQCANHKNIILKDIRSLPFIQKNEAIFNHPRIKEVPTYLLSDWYRLLISTEQARNPNAWVPGKEHVYSIYADLSIPPFLPEAISGDAKGVHDLGQYGFVFSYMGDQSRYENNFHVLSNDDAVLQSIYFVFENVFKQLISDFLNKTPPFDQGDKKLSDDIFYSKVVEFFNVVRTAKGEGTWTLNGKSLLDALNYQSFNIYDWFFPHFKKGPSSQNKRIFEAPDGQKEDIFDSSVKVPAIEILAPTSNHS